MTRFGLLGCGRIAERHSDLLGCNRIEGARLVAVCDAEQARADALASKFGFSAHYDVDDMLARKDIDVVAVLTPRGLHPQHAIACARAGKHVVVEKPMALRLQDAADIIRACDQAGVKVFIVKQNRFNAPIAKRARRTASANSCSALSACAGAGIRPIPIRMPGVAPGRMTAACSPMRPAITSTCWNGFFGDVVSVHARSTTALVKIETEDTAVATLKFRNGLSVSSRRRPLSAPPTSKARCRSSAKKARRRSAASP